MASERMRALLDDIGKVSGERLAQLSAGAGAPAAADNPLGLRLANGARVVDLATGIAGAVTRGGLAPERAGGLYGVRLDDGRLVFRGDSELEPDLAPRLPL